MLFVILLNAPFSQFSSIILTLGNLNFACKAIIQPRLVALLRLHSSQLFTMVAYGQSLCDHLLSAYTHSKDVLCFSLGDGAT